MNAACIRLAIILATPLHLSLEACRCEQRPLETYFESATLVGLAEILGADTIPDEMRGKRNAFEIRIDTLYKGFQVDRLYSATSTAACGVTAGPGDRLWVFASPTETGSRELWIDTCSGTRSARDGFLDLAPEHVAESLRSLSSVPRNEIFSDILQKIRLLKFHRDRLDQRQANALQSTELIAPNKAYRAAVLAQPKISRPPHITRVLIDSEASEIRILELHGITLPQSPEWINEKLLHARGVLGHDIRIELVIDVEANALVYSRFD